MLEPRLSVDKVMAKVSVPTSEPITTNSRLGAALIILAGGRAMEAMRTHGISKAFVYDNLRRVVRAINDNPSLKIEMGNYQELADEFRKKSDFDLFQYNVACIDGLECSSAGGEFYGSLWSTTSPFSSKSYMPCVDFIISA